MHEEQGENNYFQGNGSEQEQSNSSLLIDAASSVLPEGHTKIKEAMAGMLLFASGDMMSLAEMEAMIVGNAAEFIGVVIFLMTFAFYKLGGTHVDNYTATIKGLKNGVAFYGMVALARWGITHPQQVEMYANKLKNLTALVFQMIG